MGIKLIGFIANNFSQALHVTDSHDADIVVETESLDEGEVNLQSDVTLELLISGQHAERHAVRIAAKLKWKAK